MQNMDLDEWEFLPSNGFIDLHGGDDEISPTSNPKSMIDMDYFQKLIEPQQKKINHTRAVPVVPIEKIPVDEKEIAEDQCSEEQLIKAPKPSGSVSETCDQETISQVFFKKLKENEFVDMKMDSPKSQNMGFLPQIDVGTYQFEEKDGNFEEEQAINGEKGSNLKEDEVNWEDGNHDGGLNLNIWKWAMTGIGAVFSFGLAAATVSLIVLGNRHKEEIHHTKNPELHFQIYPHEKRIKQVVHHAKKINEAIAAVTGAPLTRAHITIGGYYEGL